MLPIHVHVYITRSAITDNYVNDMLCSNSHVWSVSSRLLSALCTFYSILSLHQMGWTPLHHAARCGSIDHCKMLMVHQCKIDIKNKVQHSVRGFIQHSHSLCLLHISPSFCQRGITALHYAARHGYTDVLTLLYDLYGQSLTHHQ